MQHFWIRLGLALTLGLALASFAAARAQEPAVAGALAVRIELPPGALADAWERARGHAVSTERAAAIAAALDATSQAAPEAPAAWRAWAADVSAESTAEQPDPARRARLALLALGQRRDEDAWTHALASTREDGWLAAVMPGFLPGVPRALAQQVATGLPDGCVLLPSMPPPSRDAQPGPIDRRAMQIEGLRVGAAFVTLRVAVEREGVQVDVTHTGGGSARLSLRIPAPEDWLLGNEYVDWSLQPRGGIAHPLELKPGDDVHTLYGRFEARAPAWPSRLPEHLPLELKHGKLWFEIPAADPARASIEELAACLRSLPLGLDCVWREPRAGGGEVGVVFDLADPALRADKLGWLAGAVERRLLR